MLLSQLRADLRAEQGKSLAESMAARILLDRVEHQFGEPGVLAAIPAVFPTVAVDGRYLMDGGVANNTPISTAVRLGATKIVVLPTGMSCAIESPPRGAMAIAMHALNLVIMQQLDRDVERFAGQAQVIVVPPLCPRPSRRTTSPSQPS